MYHLCDDSSQKTQKTGVDSEGTHGVQLNPPLTQNSFSWEILDKFNKD